MGKILQNKKTNISNEINFNDRDILKEILNTEKYMSNSFSIFLNEISNDILFKKIYDIYNDIQDAQRCTYNLMFKKGWYKVECEDIKILTDTYNKFEGYKNQFY